MATIPRIGASPDTAPDCEFEDDQRSRALAALLELLELASPESTVTAEGLAALLGAVLASD